MRRGTVVFSASAAALAIALPALLGCASQAHQAGGVPVSIHFAPDMAGKGAGTGNTDVPVTQLLVMSNTADTVSVMLTWTVLEAENGETDPGYFIKSPKSGSITLDDFKETGAGEYCHTIQVTMEPRAIRADRTARLQARLANRTSTLTVNPR